MSEIEGVLLLWSMQAKESLEDRRWEILDALGGGTSGASLRRSSTHAGVWTGRKLVEGVLWW
jgi:hypothetical protein